MDTHVFNYENSQAVQIPEKFRFNTKIVTIFRRGKDIVLREKRPMSWNEIYNMPCDDDFQLERNDNCIPQNRDSLFSKNDSQFSFFSGILRIDSHFFK